MFFFLLSVTNKHVTIITILCHPYQTYTLETLYIFLTMKLGKARIFIKFVKKKPQWFSFCDLEKWWFGLYMCIFFTGWHFSKCMFLRNYCNLHVQKCYYLPREIQIWSGAKLWKAWNLVLWPCIDNPYYCVFPTETCAIHLEDCK